MKRSNLASWVLCQGAGGVCASFRHITESPVPQACWEDHPRGFSNRPSCALSRASPSHSGVASCEHPRSDSFSPCTSLTRCQWKGWQQLGSWWAMPRVYLPVSSALFHCFSADSHPSVVPILHLRTEVPPAQKSAFYSICKAQNTRTLMPSRYYVYPPKTRGRESAVMLIIFQIQKVCSRQGKWFDKGLGKSVNTVRRGSISPRSQINTRSMSPSFPSERAYKSVSLKCWGIT